MRGRRINPLNLFFSFKSINRKIKEIFLISYYSKKNKKQIHLIAVALF